MRHLPVVLSLALAFTVSATAELVPTDTRYGPLRIRLHQVETAIDNQVAVTKVVQIFQNEHAAQLEAIYVFPTPAEATIIDFAMTVNGKVMHGELLERNQARQVYERIVARAKDPGLLEQIGKNVFRLRVFPVMPSSEQRVELTYVERISYDQGRCTWRYPVRVPGAAAATRADVFSINAQIRSAIPIVDVASASHSFVSALGAGGDATAEFRGEHELLDRDVELAYMLARPSSGFDVVAHRGDGEDGTFLLLLTPATSAGEASMPKDMTFVLDTSGSMEGEKIVQARAALGFCVAKLRPGDRFNIVRFSDAVETFRPQHVEASEENRKAARVYIDRLEALGGTNIRDALVRALQHRPERGRPHMIVFVTDGRATTGVTDVRRIRKEVLAAGDEEVRIFTFGVGNDLNRELLEDLAESTRAISCAVAPGQDLEESVSALQRRIVAPVIAGIEIDWGGADVHSVYPKRIPDLYAGVQLMIAGRYGKPGTHRVTLRGTCGTSPFEFAADVTLPEKREESPAVPYLWGARRIADLLDTIRRNGENPELMADVIRLSRRYRIATPYTSFLVLENEAAYDHEGLPRTGSEPPQVAATANAAGGIRVGRSTPRDTAVLPGDEPAIYFPESTASDHNESADAEDSGGLRGRSVNAGTYDTMGTGGAGGGGGRYGGRLGGRENLVTRGGGTRATESACLTSLVWLARHQNAEGCWSADGFPGRCPGTAGCTGAGPAGDEVGLTGLSLLGFLGAGYTHLSHDTISDPMGGQPLPFGTVVKSGVRWLISQQGADGRIGDPARENGIRRHALATLALSEAFGMTQSPILRDPAQHAVDFLLTARAPDKGWGGSAGVAQSDLETSGWCLMALHSAEISGLTVPASAVVDAAAWARKLGAESLLEAAIGMLGRILTARDITDPGLEPAAQCLVQNLPSATTPGTMSLFGTLALFQFDGPDSGNKGKYWKPWNRALVELLVKSQKGSTAACAKGSWDPPANTDPAGAGPEPGGRVYATAIHTLALEVYYRYANVFGVGRRK